MQAVLTAILPAESSDWRLRLADRP